ncbi:hydroxyacid dehydrogenase [Variovorax rhizosphaerae]|uniref:Hydroxyacid dehydrogenase n=1 Tax=Variovorax rhizosphaerae TaxID=1836200 RepID=A0ABU8WNT5_9BURK
MTERALVLGLPLLHQAGRDALRANYRLVERDDPAQVAQGIAEADALYAYPPLKVTAPMIAQAPRLKVIAAAGSGVDHIDLAAARDEGIVVTHAVGAGALSVAEHAIGHMLCLAKRLVQLDGAVREGARFGVRLDNPYEEISGRTLAIVGFGAIGRELARIAARGFGMDVIAVTRDGKAVQDDNVRRTLPLHDALAAADIVSVHTPLTASTRGLIGRAELARMKPTAWLVDTSRGGVVDAVALHEALAQGRLAGAALDVFDPEPPPTDHPLLALPNVIVSPHCAGITRGAYRRLSLAAAADIDHALRGLRPPGLVAPESWAGSRAAALSPRPEVAIQPGELQ